MKTKKLLSLLLALMMMLSVVPMYASAAETLKAANVTQWPTVSYKNADGKMYFGQTEPDALIINDDEIVIDANGNQVAGHFTFKDNNKIPLSAGTKKLNLTFVPDDTEEYTSFNKMFSSVTYEVVATVPVFVDEINDPLVASEVEAGSTLSTSILSGGKLTNPYNPEESTILTKKWEWSNPDIIVNESGYYEARVILQGYVTTTEQVYVKIASNIPETTISEMPVIEPLVYDASMTLKDVAIKGGVAVLKNEGTVVDGTFSIAESAKDYPLSVGNYNVPVTFTPTDPEAALPYTFDVPITVTKAPIKLVDETGAEIVPEITVPYGTKFNDVSRLLRPYVKGPEYVYFAMGDLESQLCANGTYTVTATAPSDGAHYEDTELTFKIVVEPKVINPKIYGTTGGSYIQDDSGTYRPEGTFDIYVDDELVHSGIKYLTDKFELTFPENVTATYTIKAVYNPVENDNFAIADIIYQKNVIAKHGLTLKNGIANYKLGDDTLAKSIQNETISITEGTVVALETVSEDFAEWIITDAKGNALDLDIKTVVTNVDENGGITWETVDGDLGCENIIFTMPTEDVIITLRTTKDIAAENCDHICHSDNPLFQMLWKVLTFIFRLFDVQQYCDCGNLHYDAPLFG